MTGGIKMSSKATKWCNKGCGKKVVYNPIGYLKKIKSKSYICQDCGTRYYRNEVRPLVKQNKNYIPTRKLPSLRQLSRMIERCNNGRSEL